MCPEEEPNVSPSFRTVLRGLWLRLADHLVSFFTPDWSLHPPPDVGTTFAKIYPLTEACGCMSTFIMRWGPSLFGHQGPVLPLYRAVFFDLRSGPLISSLQQTSASATRFVLGVCE